MEQPEMMTWWAWPYHRRFVLGVVLGVAGLLWRVRGPIGDVAVYNERVPDLRMADFVIIPLIGLGVLLVSSRPGVRLVDRIVGTGLLVIAGAWLVSRHPFQGPIVWSGPDQHGLHAGDLLAAIPGLLGLQILIRSPVPGTRTDPARRAERDAARSPYSPPACPEDREDLAR